MGGTFTKTGAKKGITDTGTQTRVGGHLVSAYHRFISDRMGTLTFSYHSIWSGTTTETKVRTSTQISTRLYTRTRTASKDGASC